MNIEQKNTLFVVLLVVAVLLAVGSSAYYLIQRHVSNEIDTDLRRAHRVFTEARRTTYDQMLTAARSISREPGLLAATLTGDRDTVRSMLEDIYPRPGIDLLAVYLDTGPGDAIAEGRKPHFSSPQVLSSPPLRAVVRQSADLGDAAYGNALVFDTLLSLAAIPIESPLGGSLGILVNGTELNQDRIDVLKQLVRADVAIFDNNVVLASTIDGLGSALPGLRYQGADAAALRFSAEGTDYIGHVYGIRSGDGETGVARMVLAHPLDSYWAPYYSLGYSALSVSLLILAVAALLGISISRASLTRPITALVEATRQIASGHLDHTVAVKRNDELGELACSFNGMLSDLSTSQTELERNRRRFHDFAESSSDWLWETDTAGRFTYVSASVSESLALEPELFLGKKLSEIFASDDLSDISKRICSGADDAHSFKDVECIITVPDGTRHYLRMNGIPALEGGEYCGYRGTTRDISKAKQDEQRLTVLVNQDQLTGLSNRRRFLIDLAHEVRRAESLERAGVLMLIDLDHFKLLNDSAGHAIGDQIIVQAAGNLSRLCRAEDLVARMSGDEFAVAFPDMNAEQACEKARQVLEAISAVRALHQGQSLKTTASIGMVRFPEQGRDAVDIMAKADAAMYAAKDAGRGRAEFFDEHKMTRERIGSQLAWKSMILAALDKDTFTLAFQPIAAVVDGTVHHYEALVRIRDDNGVSVSPANFIPMAEQFGIIGRIDKVVIKKAIRHLAALPERFGQTGIAINLSGLSVGQEDILGLIESELKATGVAPGRVTFEVTETAACENINQAVEFISRIRQMGCKISLDDFGVGFSSFSYLKHLKVDTLKIDGSFVRDITSSRDDQLFVKALVDVARGLGIRTIAEFVESAQAFDILRRLGVDYVQGYYVGKPAADFSIERMELPDNVVSDIQAQPIAS